MAKNKLVDLRDHLFETLERLKDKDDPLEIERARAICGVAKMVIDTARVEVDFVRTVGETLGQTVEANTDFFGRTQPRLPPASPVKPNGKARQQ